MGTAERRAREKETRKQAILDSAKALFARKGFENTTMDEVAREAELAKGTLYLYFKSKEELLYSLLEPLLNEYRKEVRELAAEPGPSQEAILRRMFSYMYEKYLKEPEMYHIIMRYQAKEYRELLSEENFNRLREIMRDNLKEVEKVVTQGLEAGEFHDVNPKYLSILFWNIFMGVVQYDENRTSDEGASYLKPTLDEAISILIRGLKNTG